MLPLSYSLLRAARALACHCCNCVGWGVRGWGVEKFGVSESGSMGPSIKIFGCFRLIIKRLN